MSLALSVFAAEIMGALSGKFLALALFRATEVEAALSGYGPEVALHSPSLLVGTVLIQGVAFLGTVLFWQHRKRELSARHALAVSAAEQRGAVRAAQNLTAYLSEKVTSRNSDILNWISLSRARGRTVSPRLEEASRGIANSMAELSRAAFVDPYLVKAATPKRTLCSSCGGE